MLTALGKGILETINEHGGSIDGGGKNWAVSEILKLGALKKTGRTVDDVSPTYTIFPTIKSLLSYEYIEARFTSNGKGGGGKSPRQFCVYVKLTKKGYAAIGIDKKTRGDGEDVGAGAGAVRWDAMGKEFAAAVKAERDKQKGWTFTEPHPDTATTPDEDKQALAEGDVAAQILTDQENADHGETDASVDLPATPSLSGMLAVGKQIIDSYEQAIRSLKTENSRLARRVVDLVAEVNQAKWKHNDDKWLWAGRVSSEDLTTLKALCPQLWERP